MNEDDIDMAAMTMYEELGRAEEYAHDGARLPRQFKAHVYRAIAKRCLGFAEYLEKVQ